MNKKVIVVKTQFQALHSWPEAPIQVGFLQAPHHHIFHVIVKWNVEHNDRDKEFFIMKHSLNEVISKFLIAFGGADPVTVDYRGLFLDIGRTSCEDICDYIHKEFPSCCFVSVFEDNENGVEAYYEPNWRDNLAKKLST